MAAPAANGPPHILSLSAALLVLDDFVDHSAEMGHVLGR